MESKKVNRKVRTGVVVSDKMEKTIVVRVDRMAKHSLYGKPVLRSKKFMAHDEANDCRIGDKVMIAENTSPRAQTLGSDSDNRRADTGRKTGRRGGIVVMIQLRTVLNVADNSGAKKILCIGSKAEAFP